LGKTKGDFQMTQVTVQIKTVEQKFVGGTVGGDWRIELALASDPATIVHEYEGSAPSANFDLTDNTPPDTYVVRGVRLDASGVVLGPIISTQYTVGEDLAPIDVANTISVVTAAPTRAAQAQQQPQQQQHPRR
jgi:hypothetical protein